MQFVCDCCFWDCFMTLPFVFAVTPSVVTNCHCIRPRIDYRWNDIRLVIGWRLQLKVKMVLNIATQYFVAMLTTIVTKTSSSRFIWLRNLHVSWSVSAIIALARDCYPVHWQKNWPAFVSPSTLRALLILMSNSLWFLNGKLEFGCIALNASEVKLQIASDLLREHDPSGQRTTNHCERWSCRFCHIGLDRPRSCFHFASCWLTCFFGCFQDFWTCSTSMRNRCCRF